jgi:NAD(P)-dependent dehydrogenase (short-subunit alcohol dehydrogenase family)
MRFDNKVAVITGAAVGIGKGTAIKFALEGAKVVAIDINKEKLEALKNEIEEGGGSVLTLVCDVSDEKAVNEAFDTARRQLGKIDILVNNAALWRDMCSFVDSTSELWKRYLDINIMSAVYCTRAALPDMIENGWGRIINVASVAGVYGNPNMVHYSASKGAVIAMTKALAKEVANKGVTVNCISPGSVSYADDIDAVQHDGFGYQATYIQRSGSHRENANLICFLSSDDADYIVGQNIQIDGCRKKQ